MVMRRAPAQIPAGVGRRRFSAGFSYVMLLFAVAIASIALAGTGALWQMESRREKEQELLFVGEQYRAAINSYYAKTPGGDKQYPAKLEDMLLDKRFPNPVVHLRRLYRDPMMADGQWELIRLQGQIIGVASRSIDKPIKVAGFTPEQEGFEGAEKYSAWRFVIKGAVIAPTSVAASPDGSTAIPVDGNVISMEEPGPLPRRRSR
jgi:type II secretory pathway pseudopilin PulG